MKRALTTVLIVAAVAYLGVCAAMFVCQRSLIYHPQPRVVVAAESTLKLPVEGAELVVTVRPKTGPKAIVYFGGNAEDVSFNLDSFSKAFPEHALFLLHYRGYGGSTGSPTEAANHADAAKLFRTVRAQHPEVAVIGRSLGTGVAVRLASEQPVARLILVTPYDSIVEVGATHYPWLPVRWLARERYDSALRAPRVTAPTTIIAAEHDDEIPRASTDRLLGRFNPGVAAMTVIPGVGHNDLGRRSEYRTTMQMALR